MDTLEEDERCATSTRRRHRQSSNNSLGAADTLEFSQAMQDFSRMFPSLDKDVIEAVLRAHNGSVDETIDDLLNMTMEEHVDDDGLNKHSSGKLVDLPLSSGFTPSFPHHIGPIHSIPNPISPREQAARVNKNLHPSNPAPSAAKHAQQRPAVDFTSNDLMFDVPSSSQSSHHRHPPAISREANTPSNLRVETLHLQERLHEIEWQKQVAKDPEILQFLEDERIAILLQNEEFMNELRQGDPELAEAVRSNSKKPEKSKSVQKSKKNEKKSPQYQTTPIVPVKDFDYHSSLRFQNEYKAEFQPPPLVPVKDVDFQSSLRYQTEVRAEPVNKEKIADNVLAPIGSDAFPYTKELPKSGFPEYDNVDRLKHVSKTSKQKLAMMARKFVRKQKGAKGMLGTKNEHFSGMSLLDATDDDKEHDLIDFGKISGYDQFSSDEDEETRRRNRNLKVL